MWNVVVQSRDGSLVVSAVALEVVDIRKRCPLALAGAQALAPLQDPVDTVVDSEVALVVVEDSVVEGSAAIALALAVVSDTKVAAMGLEDPLPMHLLALVVVEAAEVSMVGAAVAGLIAVQLGATVNP